MSQPISVQDIDSIPFFGEFCGIFKFKCSASRRRGALFLLLFVKFGLFYLKYIKK